MKRFFKLVLTALAMFDVAVASALIAVRLAIHGAEVEVPNLTNLTIPEASELTLAKNLQLTLANRYYSLDTPAGRIISQSPSAGTRVRRGWQVRFTESLGAQHVDIPEVIGQDEREATVNIRRLSLDLGTVAAVPAPGDPGIVLAQTPPPNAEGIDRPRVSLLISAPLTPQTAEAIVAPSLTGLTVPQAAARISAAGLRLGYLNLPHPPPHSQPIPQPPPSRPTSPPPPPPPPPRRSHTSIPPPKPMSPPNPRSPATASPAETLSASSSVAPTPSKFLGGG